MLSFFPLFPVHDDDDRQLLDAQVPCKQQGYIHTDLSVFVPNNPSKPPSFPSLSASGIRKKRKKKNEQ